MRTANRVVVAVLAVLCLATIANAGINLSVGPGVDVGDGLMSYTVSLVGTNGDLPVAFDGTFTGSLNQSKVMGSFDTPSLSFAMLLPNIAQDTHFLFTDTAVTILAGKAPAETGTSLSAAFSYSGPFTSSRLLAQIVIPAGTDVSVTGTAENAGGTKFEFPIILAPLPVGVDAGGAYEVGPDQTIQLQGAASSTAIEDWGWDLDGDGQYDDATGQNPNVSYDYLANTLGLQLGTHRIGLRANTTMSGGRDIATLTLVPEPASLSLLGLGVLGLLRRRR